MTALLTILSGVLLAAAAWYWSTRSIDGAARVALIAVLGVTAAAFNVVVPIPSIEATTTIVLCSTIALGARTGIAVGIVAVIGSSVTGGVGIWTLWQIVAVAVIAGIGMAAARTAGAHRDWFTRRGRAVLAVTTLASVVAWDVLTTAGSMLSFGAPAGVTASEQLIAALLLGAMFTLVHMVCSMLMTVAGGPPLLHALDRARPRLDGGMVVSA